MLQRRSLLLAAGALPGWALAQQSAPARLIVVLLRGAVDGLSVCAPYGDAGYVADRPTIALPAPGRDGGLLDLGDPLFGLHPALAPLLPLWQAGQLGFVQSCGQPQASRSHFEAQDMLEAGGRADSGWLARLIGLQEQGNAVRALYSAATRPKLLSGPAAQAVAALAGGNARSGRPQLNEALAKLYAEDPRYAETWAAAQRGREQVGQAMLAAAELEREMDAASNGAPPAGSFPDTARRLAQAMRADPRLQIAALELGGWDTHARQGAAQGQLANRLAPLGQGLALLARGLGPVWNDTVVLVLSEFGRTAHENGNGGTDHGYGNAVWLLGGRVAGGSVHGRWTGLEQAARHEGRELDISTDLRAVVAGVAAAHLGLRDGALQALLPDYRGAPFTGLMRG
jgi:uncharacterized protein (DUF1501 family)